MNPEQGLFFSIESEGETVVIGNDVTIVTQLEWRLEGAVEDGASDTAIEQSLSNISRIAETPAANITDVAVKIGVAAREIRNRSGDPMITLLLESAEDDCLRLTRPVLPEPARNG